MEVVDMTREDNSPEISQTYQDWWELEQFRCKVAELAHISMFSERSEEDQQRMFALYDQVIAELPKFSEKGNKFEGFEHAEFFKVKFM